MADDIIKAFLVKIGYQHDEYALKKVTQGIESVTKSILALGAGITAVSATVALTVSKIASNLETLYFASQKTGDSASSLKAFDTAAQRMGASAGTGLSAVQSLAAFFRNNPAGMGANLLSTWFPGVAVDEKDPVKTLLSLGEAMQKMEYWQAKMRGNAAGLSDDQVWFLRQPGLGSKYAEMLKELGPNFEKATRNAHEFENQLQALEITLVGFAIQVQDVLENRLGFSIKNLNVWLKAHGQELADNVVKHLQEFLALVDRLEPKFEWLLDKFIELDRATNGWSTAIIALTVLFPGLVASVVTLGAALAGLATGGAAKGIGLLGTLGRIALPVGAGVAAGAALDKYFPNNWLAKAGDYIGGKIYDFRHQKENAMLMLTNMGLTAPQAAGIVANLNAESSLQPNAVGDNGEAYGIAQWHRAGQDAFQKIFGHDIRESNLDEQLRFLANDIRPGGANENVGRALQNADAAQSGQIFSRLYERPAAGESAAQARGAEGMALYQTTHIKIDGAMEPQAVARHVADAQERTTRLAGAALVREFASVVQ